MNFNLSACKGTVLCICFLLILIPLLHALIRISVNCVLPKVYGGGGVGVGDFVFSFLNTVSCQQWISFLHQKTRKERITIPYSADPNRKYMYITPAVYCVCLLILISLLHDLTKISSEL